MKYISAYEDFFFENNTKFCIANTSLQQTLFSETVGVHYREVRLYQESTCSVSFFLCIEEELLGMLYKRREGERARKMLPHCICACIHEALVWPIVYVCLRVSVVHVLKQNKVSVWRASHLTIRYCHMNQHYLHSLLTQLLKKKLLRKLFKIRHF